MIRRPKLTTAVTPRSAPAAAATNPGQPRLRTTAAGVLTHAARTRDRTSDPALITRLAPTVSPSPAVPRVPSVGAVSYLNSRPLIEGLGELLGPACEERCRRGDCRDVCRGGGRLRLDLPSRLADALAAGQLDVALVPSVFPLARAGFEVLPDACVAAAGPVRSVKAYFRRPPGDVRTLALDEGSRTSAMLLRLLLRERFGVRPRLRPLPLDAAITGCDADAILMIGDRAMTDPPGRFAAVWDLGEEWYRWTGLPFVFAMWVSREDAAIGGVPAAVRSARDRGMKAIDAVAERESRRLGLSAADAADYLRRNLHFTLGSPERSALRLFAELLRESSLVPDARPPAYRG